jgi:ABC-type nitrate/sulfonate/bicarbonate transport system substrate-binding protein
MTVDRDARGAGGAGARVLAMAACAGLVLAACTGKRPADPSERVTFSYATIPQSALPQVAQARGFYREAGLEATVRLHKSGKDALVDLLAGNADFAVVAETPVMLAILKGERISIVATIQTSSRSHMVVARKDRGIRSLADLEGKRVAAARGASSHYFLDAALLTSGVFPSDVQLVDLPVETIPEALLKGEIDAGSTVTPYSYEALRLLGDQGIMLRDENVYRYNFVVVARQAHVRDHPTSVPKLLSALMAAEAFVHDDRAEAQEIVRRTTGMEAAHLRETWADTTLSVTLDQSLLLALEDESRWAMKIGLVPARRIPDFREFVYVEGLRSVRPEAVRLVK